MWQQTWNTPYRKDDVEAGARPLYPAMLENPQLRWGFIRKVYSILTLQLLLTIAVASVVVTVHPIAHFFVSTGPGLGLYIFLIIAPFISTYIFFILIFWIEMCTSWLESIWFLCMGSVMPFVLLSPEASDQFLASWVVYGYSGLRCGIDLCLHQW